jgi:hypothetical protein
MEEEDISAVDILYAALQHFRGVIKVKRQSIVNRVGKGVTFWCTDQDMIAIYRQLAKEEKTPLSELSIAALQHLKTSIEAKR